MEPDELKELLDTLPNSATPDEAMAHMMIAWVCAISKATLDNQHEITRDEAIEVVLNLRNDAIQIRQALIERRLDHINRAPWN